MDAHTHTPMRGSNEIDVARAREDMADCLKIQAAVFMARRDVDYSRFPLRSGSEDPKTAISLGD